MRVFKTPTVASDPETLLRTLLRQPGVASATLDLIKALNPDVDFTKDLPPATVLLMPDAADLHADTGTAIGAAELNALFSDVEAGLKAIMLRASNGLTALEKNYAAIGTLQKAAATKRIVDVDPQVKTLLQSADAQFKSDQKRVKGTQAQLVEMQKRFSNDVATLRKVIGL